MSTTSTSGSTTSVSGLVSGIDSGAIIDAMIAVERKATALIETRKTNTKNKLAIVQKLNANLLSASLDSLALRQTSTFRGRTATSSSSAVTATATSQATTGTYTFSVTSVAKAHQLASASQNSDATSLVTGSASDAGTLTLQLGSGSSTTLNFSAANGSLSNIAQSINDAGLGVTASIINDGSAYRLSLISSKTGTANAITATGGGELANLFGAGAETLVAASDATVVIGASSSSSTVTLTRSTNSISDAISGVTLNVTGQVTDATLTVAADTSSQVKALTTFFDSVNTAIEYYKANSTYDSSTKVAGALFSDSDVRNGMTAVTDKLLSVISGLPKTMNNLSALGVSIDSDTGQITYDESSITAAVKSDPDAVANLFLNTSSSTVAGIKLGALTSSSKVDTSSPFTLAITQAAAQATIGTSGSLSNTTTIASGSNSLTFNINSERITVNLAAGDYTKTDLAAALQSAINNSVTSNSNQVGVSVNTDGSLHIATKNYGSAQTISVDAGNLATQLNLTAGNSFTGTDVAGTINGVAATGVGQALSGAIGSDYEGLSFTVTATAPIASASVTVRKGIGQLVSEQITSMTKSSTGVLVTKQDSLENQITDMTSKITAADAMLEVRKARYTAQFTAMEKIIASLQTQGNAITNFTAQMNKSSSSG